MTPQEIFERLTTELGAEAVFGLDPGTGKAKDAFCEVAPSAVRRVCELMKSDPELAFDYLECLTGIDFPSDKRIQVVYHVYSYAKRHRLVLKVGLDRDDPVVESVAEVWKAANWLERECFDLLGVMFDGHPDLRRLLLPDDWLGHPLRKDWAPQANYHGIPTTRPSPLEQLGADLKAKSEAKAAAAKAAAADKPPAKADEKPAVKADEKLAAKADEKPAAKKAEKPAAKKAEKPAAKGEGETP